MNGDGGGADVHGGAVQPVAEAGPHGRDLAPVAHRHRHAPAARAQRRLQRLQRRQRDRETLELPLGAQRRQQPFEVAARVVHVGLRDLDEKCAQHGVQLDVVRLEGLAHHLVMHLAVGRHVDRDVRLHARLAAEAAPGGDAEALAQPALGRTLRADARRARDDAVFRELAVDDLHLAARADGPAAADRIEIHPERPRGREHGRATGEAPALARGRENDQRIPRAAAHRRLKPERPAHGCAGCCAGRAPRRPRAAVRGNAASTRRTGDRGP